MFPNSLEYWGPTGLPWFRNVQLRYTAIQNDTSNLMFALARPGASGDQGVYADRIELDGIRARFPLPDFAAAYKYTAGWGHVRTAGMLRRINWDDTLDDGLDLSGDATGWGLNVSSVLKPTEGSAIRMQFTVGEGIQNEMNDSPVDIGIENNLGDPLTPIVGKPVPIVAVSLFLDQTWSEHYSTAIGYSWQENDNTDAQAPERVQDWPLRARQPALLSRAERDVRRRAAMGPSREFLRRVHERRVQGAVLVQVQLLVEAWRIAMKLKRMLLAAAAVVGLAALGVEAQTPNDVQQAVDAAYAKFRTLKEGKNADYIPALAKVDPNLFGIAVVTADGKVYTAGDVKTEVSIQSISKVFTMAQVIQEQGLESVEKQIGVDATGARFNSIIAVEGVRTVVGSGAPEMNPLVNPGAISATSMVRGANADAVWQKIIAFHNDAAGRPLTVLQDVYKSESDTNQRNQAIGALMLAYGYIKSNWQQAVDLYTRQCSIGVNARDLAVMGATLAAGGKNPVTGKQVLDAGKVPGVLAVMATAGLYDDSGKWLYHTGLPAKSGVGGGIVAVSPGKFGIAVVSPPLDDAGNSVRAQRAITDISNALGGNPYGAAKPRN